MEHGGALDVTSELCRHQSLGSLRPPLTKHPSSLCHVNIASDCVMTLLLSAALLTDSSVLLSAENS